MVEQQLLLDIRQPLQMDFASFFCGQQNQQLVSRLHQLAQGQVGQVCYLWGASGAGKSHLLQALCAAAYEQGVHAIYLAGAQLVGLPPVVLEQLEYYSLVAIDDIDALAVTEDWQEALFHFYNRLHGMQHSLVISAGLPPGNLQLTLADLKSRLQASEVYVVQTLSDGEKIDFLRHAARLRGFSLGEGVAEFILQRAHREVNSLTTLLDLLDLSSLSQQRQITVPFVKQVLNI